MTERRLTLGETELRELLEKVWWLCWDYLPNFTPNAADVEYKTTAIDSVLASLSERAHGQEARVMGTTEFKPGDAVVFMQTCRGGYGFQRGVPAVFVSAGEKRHAIRVTSADGSRIVVIHVAPRNLRAAREGR